MFLLVAKRLSNQQFKAVKSIMPVNQFFIKIFFKMYLSKLLPQKMHFQNCFFKKYITELAPQKKFFKNCSLKSYIFKSFPQKNLKNLSPQKMHFQNCFLKISIFKIAFSVSVCWEGTFQIWLQNKKVSYTFQLNILSCNYGKTLFSLFIFFSILNQLIFFIF